MTRQEFEQQYAESEGAILGLTPGRLHDLGLYAVPCDCGEDECLGWQMRNLSNLLTPRLVRSVEHIPDDWNWLDLEDDLIAEGKTELLIRLRFVARLEQEKAE